MILLVIRSLLNSTRQSDSTDVSTTMIVEPGPVINFILSNQYIKDPRRIDWGKVSHGLDATHVFPQ